MKCNHNWINADNEGCYGKEVCTLCGDTIGKDENITDREKKKQTIYLIIG